MEEKVVSLPQPQQEQIDMSAVINIISAWKGILNARLLALIALVGALGIYSLALYDPSSLRLWGAGIYSIGVLWPVMALYFRKG